MFSLKNVRNNYFLQFGFVSGLISDSCTLDESERVRVRARVENSCTLGGFDSDSIFWISKSDSDLFLKTFKKLKISILLQFIFFQIGFGKCIFQIGFEKRVVFFC